MDLPHRVATRFVLSESIGDPHDLTRKFEYNVQYLAKSEPELPKAKAAREALAGGREDLEASRFYSTMRYRLPAQITAGFKAMRVLNYNLFLALLQQYSLEPKLRKAVEAAAKFYSKGRINSPDKNEEIEFYEKYLSIFRSHLELAKTVLSKSQPRGQGGTDAGAETKSAGPFTIVNTGGFDDTTMAETAKIVEKAATLLHHKGLGKVCYGEVLVSNTLSKSNVLAFYLVDKDEMFVRSNLKGKASAAVSTIIHELAHRLHFKFLNGRDRDIQRMYQEINRKERSSAREVEDNLDLTPAPGDQLVDKGTTYVVTGLGWHRGTRSVQLGVVGKPDRSAVVSLVAWAKLKGLTPSRPVDGFVSTYAAKNHEENFAEMVAHYCLGTLPESQVALLESIFK